MPGLWTHKWRPIQFTLAVDNFGVKYVRKEHDEHFMYSLQEYYTITHDWGGKNYVDINLYWDHQNNQVHLLCQDTPTLICNDSTTPPPPDVRTHLYHTHRQHNVPK